MKLTILSLTICDFETFTHRNHSADDFFMNLDFKFFFPKKYLKKKFFFQVFLPVKIASEVVESENFESSRSSNLQ